MIFESAAELVAFMTDPQAVVPRDVVVLADQTRQTWLAFLDPESCELYIRTIRVEPEPRFNQHWTQQVGLGIALTEGYYLADTPNQIWPLMAIALPVAADPGFYVDLAQLPHALRRPSGYELALTCAAALVVNEDLDSIDVARRWGAGS